MDDLFQLYDVPRKQAVDIPTDIPVLTAVWRSMQASRKRKQQQMDADNAATQKLRDALAQITAVAHDMAIAHAGGDCSSTLQLASIADRMRLVLAAVGYSWDDETAVPYTQEKMKRFDSVAQQILGDITEPMILEVLAPAILCDGELVQRGKVIVGLPSKFDSAKGTSAPEE